MYICVDEVLNNCKRNKISLLEELTRVIIHGVLHMLGYEHGEEIFIPKNVKSVEMFKIQEIILNKIVLNL